MGWVYYATYLCYFEVGRSELMRALWMPYRKLEERGFRLPVVEAHCRYLSGAKYDDELDVHTEVTLPTPVRVRFDYQLNRVTDSQPIATGHTLHCFLHDGKIVRIPEELRLLVTS